jgi:NAD(P)-dependent dehydrogenase (short-subunit alcohol dehydrogenase family)
MSEHIALVTGATRGIGRAVVETLVRTGRRVVATGRDQTRLSELAQAHGQRVVTVACDLSVRGAWTELLDQVDARVGALDEFVSNAGIVHYAGLGGVSEEALRAQLELDFVVPYLLSQRVGVAMKQRGRGAIVHVASTLGERPAADTSAYGASKAALINATRSFALELAPAVRVNAVAPGIVDTEMVQVLRAEAKDRAAALTSQRAAFAALHPLGRLGTPEEIAAAVLFLLEAPWITGSVLTIDGGVSLH